MRYSILCVAVCLIFGCSKEEIDPEDYNTDPQNGLVVKEAKGVAREGVVSDEKLEKFISSISANTISISSLYPKADELKKGNTIVLGVTGITPEGLIAKIENVATSNDRYIIDYSVGSISDVFSQLSYDISYFNTNSGISKREFAVEKELFDNIAIEFSGTQAVLDITPEFGMNYEFVGIFDIDFDTKELNEMTFGFKNVNIEAGFNAEVFAHANGVGKVSSPKIPLPPINFLVAEIPVVINSRVSVNASAGLDVKGGFDIDVSMNTNSFDAVIDFGPQYKDGWSSICKSDSICFPQVDFDIEFNDLQGAASLTLAKQYAFEFTMYNAYDALTIGTGISLPEVEFTTELKFEDEQAKAIITGKAGFPLEYSFTTEVLDILIDIFKSNGLSTSFKITVPTVDLDLFEKEFVLPCNVQMNNSIGQAECDATGDMISLVHGLDSSNGSPQGYRLNVDGHELGTFAYGTLHTTLLDASKMKYLGTVSMRDAGSPGCRVELSVSNPCQLLSFCEGDPVVDVENQEYCYQTMADGKQWLNSSLLTSFGGTAGICHDNDPNNCFAIGRYYQFDELGDDICPSGWHIPSKDEWNYMLTLEAQSVGSTNFKVSHLLTPSLTNFGNVSKSKAKGFNILPTGMYQGWKEDIPFSERFTGSVFDDGVEFGYLWTGTALTDDGTNNEFSGEGAWALLMRSSGQYSFKKVSKSAGMVCRCIKN